MKPRRRMPPAPPIMSIGSGSRVKLLVLWVMGDRVGRHSDEREKQIKSRLLAARASSRLLGRNVFDAGDMEDGAFDILLGE